MKNKQCVICGKEFKPTNNKQKYCSDECRKVVKRDKYKRRYWEDKAKECCSKHGGIDNCPYDDCICEATNRNPVCKHCGKPFTPKGRNQKFCSVECRFEYRKAHKKKSNRVYIKECPICKKQFGATHFNQKYCSDGCFQIARSQQSHKYYMQKRDYYLNKHREWKKKNKEHVYQMNNEWKKNNPDKVHEYNARRYQEHKEEVKASVIKWRQENPERYRETRMKWEKRNPDKLEMYYEKSKARKYKKRHHITESYCLTHNDCLNCPYPYNVCLHE